MLASLLPGIRELRVPLAVGLMWLAVMWVLLSPLLRDYNTNSLAGDIVELFQWLSLPVALAAVAFLGYVVGLVVKSITLVKFVGRFYSPGEDRAMTELISRVYSELLRARHRGVEARTILRQFPEISVIESARFSEDERFELVSIAAAEAEEPGYRPSLNYIADQERWDWILSNASLFAGEAIATRARFSEYLLVKHRDAFDKLDRTIAEAEFRESIALPTLALAFVAGLRLSSDLGSDWIMFAIIPVLLAVLWLTYSSLQMRQEGEGAMARYIVSGIFESSVIVTIAESKAEASA